MNRRDVFKAIGVALAGGVAAQQSLANRSYADWKYCASMKEFPGAREKIKRAYSGVRRAGEPLILRPGIRLVKVPCA